MEIVVMATVKRPTNTWLRLRTSHLIAAAVLAGAGLLGSASHYGVIGPASAASPQGDATTREQPAGQSTSGALAQAPATSSFSPEQEDQIRSMIKEYLVKNPEILLEMQAAYEAKMEKVRAEQLKVALSEHSGDIFKSSTAPIVGNPKGDVTVVEFFDYNCGYCKRALGDVSKLIQKDTNVKVVFKELPILSKGSEEASRVALAAKAQGKYWEVHRALLEAKGQLTEATALKAAEKFGLDMSKLKKDMAGDDVQKEIDKVRELAQKMGIQGTPHFLVGERVIAGAPGDLLEQLGRNIAEIRQGGGCKVC